MWFPQVISQRKLYKCRIVSKNGLYARLRKFLLKDVYIRIGPDVFMRVVQNRKASEKHYQRIDEVKPKTGVVAQPKEGEIVLTQDYEALGEYYMTAIMPVGVRKPKQPHKGGAILRIAISQAKLAGAELCSDLVLSL